MHKRTTSLLCMTIGSLIVTGVASADLQGISFDSFDSGFGIGLTHRVYVDVDSGMIKWMLFLGILTLL